MTIFNKTKLLPTVLSILTVCLLAACSSTPEPDPTATPAPTNTPPPAPTDTPEPTPTEVPTEVPTEAPTETPTPAPTNTPVPEPTELSSGDTLYETTFASLDDWFVFPLNEDDPNYQIEPRDDGLYVVVPNANDSIALYSGEAQMLENVKMEANIELVGGTNYTYYTMICRSGEDGAYVFYLDTGGFWQIGKYSDGYAEYEQLGQGGSFAINLAKASNKFGAVCNGDTLSMFVNDELLGEVTDSSYSVGDISIGVETFDQANSQVLFKDFKIVLP